MERSDPFGMLALKSGDDEVTGTGFLGSHPDPYIYWDLRHGTDTPQFRDVQVGC
jgi:hypothetical protein